MFKNTLAMVLLTLPLASVAELTEKDLVTCNKIANAGKRLQCLKEITGLNSTQDVPIQSPMIKPLSVTETFDICGKRISELKSKKNLAKEHEGQTNLAVIAVTWSDEEGRPLGVCAVDRETKQIRYVEHNGQTITAAMYEKMDRDAETLRKVKAGDYSEFLVRIKSELTKNFKDPASVLYRNLFISDRGSLAVCGELNGKNSYGAYVGFQRFYASEVDGLNGIETSEDSHIFNQTYSLMCGKKILDIPLR